MKDKQIKRNAKRLPKHMRDIAASKCGRSGQREYDARKLGKFGSASPVRHIDPEGYEVKEKPA